MLVAPKKKVTVSPAIVAPPAGFGVIVAVNCTPCPKVEGFKDDAVTAVVVVAIFTVCEKLPAPEEELPV
jgi:hypothetical protein